MEHPELLMMVAKNRRDEAARLAARERVTDRRGPSMFARIANRFSRPASERAARTPETSEATPAGPLAELG